MGGLNRDYQIDGDVTPLVKEMTQEAINLFEGSSGETGPSQFTDDESARETLGTSGTVKDPIDGSLQLQVADAFPKLKWEGWEGVDEKGRIKPMRPMMIPMFTCASFEQDRDRASGFGGRFALLGVGVSGVRWEGRARIGDISEERLTNSSVAAACATGAGFRRGADSRTMEGSPLSGGSCRTAPPHLR